MRSITNTEDQSNVILRNRQLNFVNLVATVIDSRVQEDTLILVYYSESSKAAASAAGITVQTNTGNITFTAVSAPSQTIVCDIVLLSANIVNQVATASDVDYSNTVSGLAATDLQSAVDEVNQSVQDTADELQSNFQAGVDAVYDAVVAKGSTPASKSLADVVQGIENIETGITPTGTINITSNGTKDVTNYASANVNVPNSNSSTYTASTRSTSIDMGATNTYRYVNTNNVPNSNSATYTTTTRENKDLGAANTYRYVNTSNMPNVNSTTYTATTRSTKIDLGAANTYRYLVTSGVPNSNSTTYTYGSGSTGGKVDMGATNTYRYVNAANVYDKGKNDFSFTKDYTAHASLSDRFTVDMPIRVTVSNGSVTVTALNNSSAKVYILGQYISGTVTYTPSQSDSWKII